MLKRTKSFLAVLYSYVRFHVIKLFRRNGFSFYSLERFSPNTMINIWKTGTIKLGNKVRAHSGVRLSSTNQAVLEIGDNTAFNYNCIVVARKRIRIGKNCTFGPGVVVYDHDHDFRNGKEMNGDLFVSEEIEIGDNVWIGANAIILKGAHIGNNCVVAAGTVVNTNIEDNCVIYNPKEQVIKKYK